CQVKCLDQNCAIHLDAMFDSRGYPDGSIGRHHPLALCGVHPHHTFTGINELMPVMDVRRDRVASEMTGCEASNDDLAVDHVRRQAVAMTLFRHSVAF